jgi:hypothetical protein
MIVKSKAALLQNFLPAGATVMEREHGNNERTRNA